MQKMIDWFEQLFCRHEFKRLKDDSYLCGKCDKRKEKTIPDIRKTNNCNNNMEIIKRLTKIEKERNESVR